MVAIIHGSAPAEWSRWNVSSGLAVVPAWPAETVGVAQPDTRRMQGTSGVGCLLACRSPGMRTSVSCSLGVGAAYRRRDRSPVHTGLECIALAAADPLRQA